MNSGKQLIKVIGVIALAAMIGVGCTSRSVRYTGNSESMKQDGTSYEESVAGEHNPNSPSGDSRMSKRSQNGGEFTDSDSEPSYAPPPFQDKKWAYTGEDTPQDIDHQSLEYSSPGESKPGEWAGYGHDYAGVPGYGSGNGPVTGFSSTLPEEQGMSADPEAWANAYLRGGSSGDGLSAEHIERDRVATESDADSLYGSQRNGVGSKNGMHQDLQSRNLEFSGLEYSSNGEVKDVYFEFDSWNITPAGARSLEADADWLKAHSDKTVTIEGHCDLRGTQDYNIVLGKKRAEAARDYLVDLGVSPTQMKVVSYGKERPFCSDQNEYCYQQNRRSHFVGRIQ